MQRSFYGLHLFKHFLASLWLTTALSTLNGQLNSHGQEAPPQVVIIPYNHHLTTYLLTREWLHNIILQNKTAGSNSITYSERLVHMLSARRTANDGLPAEPSPRDR
jgi:hypothetical protein